MAAAAEPSVFLVTGPQAAGKTTVARLLAGRFARGVHLEGDTFRRNIVAGRAEMMPTATPEALAQLRLRYRIAATAAELYADADFTVAFDDVVAGPLLEDVVALIRRRPLHVVVLLPDVATLTRRAAARGAGYGGWTPEQLHRLFADETPRLGLWLDTSRQNPEETVDTILARVASAP